MYQPGETKVVKSHQFRQQLAPDFRNFRITQCYHPICSRTRKESSSVSLDDIKELINSKLETTEVNFNAIENKFDAVQADFQNAIRVVENKADEATKY